MKKFLSCLLSVGLMSGTFVPANAANEDWMPRDESITRFAVMGDSHFTTEASVASFKKALSAYNTMDSSLDGILLMGDVIYQNDSAQVIPERYDLLSAALQENNADTPVVYAMGNHEYPQANFDETISKLARDTFEEKTGQTVNYSTVLDGYHVITAAAKDYSGTMTAETEAWIKAEVQDAVAEDENKPVFLMLHHPIQGTVSEGEAGIYTDEFKSFLQQYPQVINLTAHEHYAAQMPECIWQNGFTAIESFCMGTNGAVHNHGVIQTSDYDICQTMMIEVSDNVVSVYRMDVKNGRFIGDPWVINVEGIVNGTDSFHYTEDRAERSNIPYFAEGAAITVDEVKDNSATISFPKADNAATDEWAQDGFVKGYQIEARLADGNDLISSMIIPSDFYQAARPEEMKASYTAELTNLIAGKNYVISVAGISPYGKIGTAITTTAKTSLQGFVPAEGEAYFYAKDYNAANRAIAVQDNKLSFQPVPDWADYLVTTEKAGWYQMKISAGNGNTDEGHLQIIVNCEEENWATIGSTGGYFTIQDFVLDQNNSMIYLPEGESTIRVYNATTGKSFAPSATGMIFAGFTLSYQNDEPDADTHLIYAKDYTDGFRGFSYTGGKTVMETAAHYIVYRENNYGKFEINVPKSGIYTVTTHMGIGGDQKAGFSLSVNSQDPEIQTQIDPTGGYETIQNIELGDISLNQGKNTLRLALDGVNPAFVESLTLTLKEEKLIDKSIIKLNALYTDYMWDGKRGVNTASGAGGYTGALVFCRPANGRAATYAEYTVNVPEDGSYNMIWTSGHGEPANSVIQFSVNGVEKQPLSLKDSGSMFTMLTQKAGEVFLKKGGNKIRFTNADGMSMCVDSITFAKASAALYQTEDGEKISELMPGTNICKLSLNGTNAGESLLCVFAVYEDGRLVKTAVQNVESAPIFDAVTMQIDGLEKQEGKTYTARVFAWTDVQNGLKIGL